MKKLFLVTLLTTLSGSLNHAKASSFTEMAVITSDPLVAQIVAVADSKGFKVMSITSLEAMTNGSNKGPCQIHTIRFRHENAAQLEVGETFEARQASIARLDMTADFCVSDAKGLAGVQPSEKLMWGDKLDTETFALVLGSRANGIKESIKELQKKKKKS